MEEFELMLPYAKKAVQKKQTKKLHRISTGNLSSFLVFPGRKFDAKFNHDVLGPRYAYRLSTITILVVSFVED